MVNEIDVSWEGEEVVLRISFQANGAFHASSPCSLASLARSSPNVSIGSTREIYSRQYVLSLRKISY